MKQDLFVKIYITNGFNGTQAAKDAGYSQKTARYIAAENLTKPLIIEAIRKQKTKIEKRIEEKYDLKRERILDDLVEIATADISRIITVKDGRVQIKSDLDAKALNMLDSLSITRTRGEQSDSDSFSYKRENRLKSYEMIIKLAGLDGSGNSSNKKDWETTDKEISDAIEEYQE